jgi:putative transposase
MLTGMQVKNAQTKERDYSHLRRRKRAMLRFLQMKLLQKFAAARASFHNHFALERHLVDRQTFKQRRAAAWAEWQSFAG